MLSAASAFRGGDFDSAAAGWSSVLLKVEGAPPETRQKAAANLAACYLQRQEFQRAVLSASLGVHGPAPVLQAKCFLRRALAFQGLADASADCRAAAQADAEQVLHMSQVAGPALCSVARSVLHGCPPASPGGEHSSELLTSAHSLRLQAHMVPTLSIAPGKLETSSLCVTVVNEFGLFSQELLRQRRQAALHSGMPDDRETLAPVAITGRLVPYGAEPVKAWECPEGADVGTVDTDLLSTLQLNLAVDCAYALVKGNTSATPGSERASQPLQLDAHARAVLRCTCTAMTDVALPEAARWIGPLAIRLAAEGTGSECLAPCLSPPLLLPVSGGSPRAAPTLRPNMLRPLDCTWGAAGEGMSLALLESPGAVSIAGRVWDAGIAVAVHVGHAGACHALHAPACDTIGGLCVVELGAGTGVSGIVLAGVLERAEVPASVVLTDIPHAIPRLADNIRHCHLQSCASSAPLWWGKDPVDALPGAPPRVKANGPWSGLRAGTLCLMADVVYDEDVYEGLTASLLDVLGVEAPRPPMAEVQPTESWGEDPPPCLPPLLHLVAQSLQGGSMSPEADAAILSLRAFASTSPPGVALPFAVLGYRPRHASAADWWAATLAHLHCARVWVAQDTMPPLPHDNVLDCPSVLGVASAESPWHPPTWAEDVARAGTDLSIFLLWPRVRVSA